MGMRMIRPVVVGAVALLALGMGGVWESSAVAQGVRAGGPGSNAKPPLQRSGSRLPANRPSTQPRPSQPAPQPPSIPGDDIPGHTHPHYPHYPRYGYRGYYGYPYSYIAYRYYYPIYGPTGFVDPYLAYAAAAPRAPEPVEPVRELTDLEKADVALREGDAEEAVRLYRAHLDETPDDAKAMRGLAMALIDDDEIDQACAVMALAYETDPKLATRPIDKDLIHGEKRELRRRVGNVVAHAHRAKTSSAWLTVAVLMQVQDKDDRAMEMVRRATALGLREDVSKAMMGALAS